jgi:hypothetical protein
MRPIYLAGGWLLVLLLGSWQTAPAQDLDEVKRQMKIAADELEAKVKARLDEAEQVARKDPARAIHDLAGLESQVAGSAALTSERKKELRETITAKVRTYQQAFKRRPEEERERMHRELEKEITTRNEELKRMQTQASEAFRKGDLGKVGDINDQIRQKYGASPATFAADKIATAGTALKQLQEIKNQRSVAFRQAFRNLLISSMPITGDVVFPEDFARRTKMRQQFKLTEKEKKLIRALETVIPSVEIKAQPLQAVLEGFEKQQGIKINVDPKALEDSGLNVESTLSIKAERRSLSSVLKTKLGNVGLTYVIVNGELRVTTPAIASTIMSTRSYFIGDLVEGVGFGLTVGSRIETALSIAALIKMIESIEPASWQSGGGPGTIVFNPAAMTITVKQSAEMHFALQGQFGR